MADGGEAHTLRYSAFISYSHHDAAFARRLHRKLESYRLPRKVGDARRLAGSRRLRPIFRDRDELVAAADLTEAVQDAISEADALIVVCSRAAAASVWVGREVEAFRLAHGDRTVLAALIDGDETTAFPAALRQARPGGRLMQPLAADFRPDGDGERLALLKLVAVLAGVRLDALVQRDAARRMRVITVAAAASVFGMAVMTGLAFVAMNARAVAEAERNRGETLIDFMLTDLREKLKGVGHLYLLDAVDKGALAYFVGQDLSQMSSSALEERAKLLQAVGEDDEKRGRFDEARQQFEEAARTTSALLTARPNDQGRIFIHAQSEFWLGFIDWRTAHHARAELAFRAYAALADRLVALSPNNTNWFMEVGNANLTLGTVVLRRSKDIGGAIYFFTKALANFNKVSMLPVEDAESLEDISECYGWLGDTERLQGHFPEALALREQEHSVLKHLLFRDKDNSGLQARLVYNILAEARIDAESHAFKEALMLLDQGKAKAMALASSDPDNGDLQREVWAFELFNARTWFMTPDRSQWPRTLLMQEIGSCEAYKKIPNNAELLFFCEVLHARWLNQNADHASASPIVTAPALPSELSGDRLTSRWGLDLDEEKAALLSSESRKVAK